MAGTAEFSQHRSALFGLAYRMLGSVLDAEDILQEAFLRWRNVSESDVRSPRAYLMTIVTRLSVDRLRRAHVQREAYVGAWLPEPLLPSPEDDPAWLVELDESLSTAFLLLLEKLSPVERAVFLLHEVFNYTFAEIATIVGRNLADCRQIGHRARQRIREGRPRFEVETETVDEIVEQFLQACAGQDLAELLGLLAPDVSVITDSGGKVSAVRNVVVGVDRVARLMLGLFRKCSPRLIYHIAKVNGQPALVGCLGERLVNVTSFKVRNGKIQALYQVLNPEKLPALDCSADSLEGLIGKH